MFPSARRVSTSKAGEKARFDQQPVEAGATVSACLEAYRATGDERWRTQAWAAFNWFLGDNDLKTALYDATTGGCRDGLHPDRANENQGAESTLSFLMALLEMRQLQDASATDSTLHLECRQPSSAFTCNIRNVSFMFCEITHDPSYRLDRLIDSTDLFCVGILPIQS